MGSRVPVLYTVLLLACTSVGLTLYLSVTPLRSSSDAPHILTMNMQKKLPERSKDREDIDLGESKYNEDHGSAVEYCLDESIASPSDRSFSEVNVDLSEKAIGSDNDSYQSVHDPNLTACSSTGFHPNKSKSPAEANLMKTVDKGPSSGLSDSYRLERVEIKDSLEKDMEVLPDVHTDKNNEEGDALGPEESSRGYLDASTSECPGSCNSAKGNGFDGDGGPGSLSKLSGLGRGARRQFTIILDEFWGHLFDSHGKLTQEASTRRVDVLLGLDLKTVGSSAKADTIRDDCLNSYFPNEDRGVLFLANSGGYLSPEQKRNQNVELSPGLQMGSRPWSQSMQGLETNVQSSCFNLLEASERHRLCSQQYSDIQDYQPATIHGYQVASYLRGFGVSRNPYASGISLDPIPSKSAASFMPNSRDLAIYSCGQNGLGSLGASSQSPAMSGVSRLQVERPYNESSLMETSENVTTSAYTKKYHTSPDIYGIIASLRISSLTDGNALWGRPNSPGSSFGRMTYEPSQYLNPVSTAGVPLAFDELTPPKLHGDVFSSQSTFYPDDKSLWSRQPFEQLFGMTCQDQIMGDRGVANQSCITKKESFSYKESETKLLQSFRLCMMKLLKLEGSDWLFKQNGGRDEELIDRVAAAERCVHEADGGEINQAYMAVLQNVLVSQKFSSIQRLEKAEHSGSLPLPNCGDGCIWRAILVVSFGMWCVRRILELSLVESRPELWGKYTYVLNRLQGILETAFSKPRQPFVSCSCLEMPVKDLRGSKSLQNGKLPSREHPNKGIFTTASMIFELIKDVETAVSSRKGRMGTAAGDVAFRRGKENLASVLKRYKRRLLKKPPATNDSSSSSRKISLPSASLVL